MALSSTFNSPHGDLPGKTESPGVYDHNDNPNFSKPHDKGPDTIPLKFKESIGAHPGPLESPMGTGIEMNKK